MSVAYDAYEALLLDLDGTVYHGPHAVDGAADAVRAAQRHGTRIRFVTNNASRGPSEVAAQLTAIGVPAEPVEVSTSAQAAAAVLGDMLPAGERVLVVGTPALTEEITAVGLRPVHESGDGVRAVVQGLSQRVGWPELAEACLTINAGGSWVACNVDTTLPTERGLLPGNGAFVAALTAATGAHPIVAGKPERPLLDQAVRSCGARSALVVGDRLDTDIAGANNADLDGLLVFTGVSTPWDVLTAPAPLRPGYLGQDIRSLDRPLEELAIGEHAHWQVRAGEGVLHVGSAADPGDVLPLLRAMCAVWWKAGGGVPAIRALDDRAHAALRELGVLDTGAR